MTCWYPLPWGNRCADHPRKSDLTTALKEFNKVATGPFFHSCGCSGDVGNATYDCPRHRAANRLVNAPGCNITTGCTFCKLEEEAADVKVEFDLALTEVHIALDLLMAKAERTCTFFYAVTTEAPEGTTYKGELHAEPVKFADMKDVEFGRKPEFCCEMMAEAYPHDVPAKGEIPYRSWEPGQVYWTTGKNNEPQLRIRSSSGYSYMTDGDFMVLTYCPFCGARIVHQENTHLRRKERNYTEKVDRKEISYERAD